TNNIKLIFFNLNTANKEWFLPPHFKALLNMGSGPIFHSANGGSFLRNDWLKTPHKWLISTAIITTAISLSCFSKMDYSI
ncbi:hypothetical protein, partial [Bacillus sp. MMSF_3328]|uniref:hypothetical protein n=1 Tax=Bacillus sp. MMSF_3328 TaxID=3047080 RepID=UPI00273F8982